jgi:DNA-binding response OmpR family regulator
MPAIALSAPAPSATNVFRLLSARVNVPKLQALAIPGLDLSVDALVKDTSVQKKQILVVEDDPYIARTISWNLWEAGYVVSTAEDGLAALHAFDTGDFALVTLDLMLPMISGFRLARLFKRARPEVPVMIISSLSFEESEEVARTGVDDFLTKPFDPQLLVDKVRFHLHPTTHHPFINRSHRVQRAFATA